MLLAGVCLLQAEPSTMVIKAFTEITVQDFADFVLSVLRLPSRKFSPGILAGTINNISMSNPQSTPYPERGLDYFREKRKERTYIRKAPTKRRTRS